MMPHEITAPPTSHHDALDRIRHWLSSCSGITYPDHKVPVLEQRLTRVLSRFDLADLSAMAQGLSDGARHDLHLAVIHAASINHTFFFREGEVLDNFSAQAIPHLLRQPDIRIWSAACSTGDEAYTIAIMMAEVLGHEGLGRLSILGTDISGPSVERAEAALFSTRQLTECSPALLRRYFDPLGIDQYRVVDALRHRCIFRRMNLKASPYPFVKKFHAVFCRNILYYFDQSDQRATLAAIHAVTEEDGWLVTSVTEPIRSLSDAWEPMGPGLYRRLS